MGHFEMGSYTVCQGIWHTHACVVSYYAAQAILPYYFEIYTCEESNLPMKHTKNYIINIFDNEGQNFRHMVGSTSIYARDFFVFSLVSTLYKDNNVLFI